MVSEVGERGKRIERMRDRKESPSKVNWAPRRAWACAGSGMAESWARDRW